MQDHSSQVADLPLLRVVVELDVTGARDRQLPEFTEIDGFGVETADDAVGLDREGHRLRRSSGLVVCRW